MITRNVFELEPFANPVRTFLSRSFFIIRPELLIIRNFLNRNLLLTRPELFELELFDNPAGTFFKPKLFDHLTGTFSAIRLELSDEPAGTSSISWAELLDPWDSALQELNTTMRDPHGGRQLSWNCHARCPCVRT